MTRCTVCGYCPCCGLKGRDIGDKHFQEWFPKRVKELKEHYEIFPEHHKPQPKGQEEGMNIEKDFWFDIPEGTKRVMVQVLVEDSSPSSSVGDDKKNDYTLNLKVQLSPRKF